MKITGRTVGTVVAVMAAGLISFGASAQDEAADFPNKPIKLIIPAGPGGSHDLTARAVTSVANQYLGQPIVVELRPGGGGAIGSEEVRQAAPDGYTMLMGGPNWNSTLSAVENRPYGPDNFETVCRINFSPVMVAAALDTPYKTFDEMIDWAKAHSGELVFGHTGPWSQSDLTWKQISQITGIETRNVPHEGGGPSTVALIGGHIDVAINPTTTFFSAIQSEQIRPLALLSDERDDSFPDVPTAKELGVDVVYDLWRGFLVPKDTPEPIVKKLSDACKQMVEDPTVVALIKKFGDNVNYLSADEFEPVWRKEYEAHKAIGEALK